MLLIYDNLLFIQLLFQPFSCCRVAKEECSGIFIIHKIAVWVLIRERPSLSDRFSVVLLIFPDFDAELPKKLFLPFFCIRRHMNNDPKSENCTDNTDAEPQISCGSHLNRILPEYCTILFLAKHLVAVAIFQEAGFHRKILRVFQHLINPAPCLDGTCNGKMAVFL